MKRLHSVGEQTLYHCKICTFQSKHPSSVKKHVKNVHQKSENVICTECNKYIQKINLSRHMKSFHSAGEQTQYNCNICTFQSKHLSYVKKHVKRVHQKKVII